MSDSKARGMFANVADKKKSSKRGPLVSQNEIEDGDKPFASAKSAPSPSAVASKPSAPAVQSEHSPASAVSKDGEYRVIDSKLIRTWKFKDRTVDELQHDPKYSELLASVRASGVLEPILVRALPEPDSNGCLYEGIAGFKRLSAATALGQSIRALVIDVDDVKGAVIQEQENAGRSEPSAWGRATNYLRLLDGGVYTTQTQLADGLDINKSYLSNLLRVARRMPEDLVKSLPLTKLGSTSLIYMITKLDAVEGSAKEALIDRIVEFADDFNAKPEKASDIIDKAVASLSEDSRKVAGPASSVYQSQKGKTLTVKAKDNQVAVTFHEGALAVASVEDITDAITEYLAKKGLSLEQVQKKKK